MDNKRLEEIFGDIKNAATIWGRSGNAYGKPLDGVLTALSGFFVFTDSLDTESQKEAAEEFTRRGFLPLCYTALRASMGLRTKAA